MTESAVDKKLSKVKYCSKGVICCDIEMSILMIWKQTDGYIYQLVSGEFPFAVTCLVKK